VRKALIPPGGRVKVAVLATRRDGAPEPWGVGMADLLPSFARKREAINHAVFTKALTALRKSVQGLSGEDRERFQCLVADVARTLAWAAGRRDWLSLLDAATRGQGEEFSTAIRKMGLAESLETALWAAMRAQPHGLFRNALALVAIRLHLGTAWVHGEVLQARDAAGAMILDAFDVAELSPSRPADLSAEDFRIGDSTVGGDIFEALKDDVFSRAMDPDTALTERCACSKALRDAFDIDPPGGGVGGRGQDPGIPAQDSVRRGGYLGKPAGGEPDPAHRRGRGGGTAAAQSCGAGLWAGALSGVHSAGDGGGKPVAGVGGRFWRGGRRPVRRVS
jgi:hypothetical protein